MARDAARRISDILFCRKLVFKRGKDGLFRSCKEYKSGTG